MPKKSKFVSRISLAAFPVAIVMILLAVEILVRQHILFTSLIFNYHTHSESDLMLFGLLLGLIILLLLTRKVYISLEKKLLEH